MLDWVWLCLEVTALYVPMQFFLDRVAGLVFGIERVKGAHWSVARTEDARPIFRRAMLHLPIGLLYCLLVASNIRFSEPPNRYSAFAGCIAFIVVEVGSYALQARRYWESGHLQARAMSVKTMAAIIPFAILGLLLAVINVPTCFLMIRPLAEKLGEIAESIWWIPVVVFGGIATLVALVATILEFPRLLEDIKESRNRRRPPGLAS